MAAMCVQDVDVQGVLQFTLILAVGCALHRHTSRVIHHSKSVVLRTVQEIHVLDNPPIDGRLPLLFT